MIGLLTSDSTAGSGGRPFEQTQWTLILKAADQGNPEGAAAMEEFARAYWPAIYRFIRREGCTSHDAHDLTQAFYQHFLENDLLARIKERRGKFRSFLLTCLKHFLSDDRDHARALKRGGGRTLVALDALEAEERDAIEPVESVTADQLYDRRWAQTVMEMAAARLRDEYTSRGKADLYNAIKDLQPGRHGEETYAAIGARLGMKEQAIKDAVRDFRIRYGDMVRQEVAKTVSDPEEVDEEIRNLIEIMSR